MPAASPSAVRALVIGCSNPVLESQARSYPRSVMPACAAAGHRAATTRKMRIHHTDLRGVNRLTIDAVAGLTDLVEAVHHTIARAPAPLGPPARGTTRGITGLVYRSIRTVTGLVGHGLDRLLAQLVPELGEQSSWPAREAVLAALNGVLGDYLAASRNPLAIRMQLRRDGKPLVPDARSLAKSIARPGGKLVVLVHGLCTNDLQWNRRG